MAPSFLTLPPELRLQIYQYLLCSNLKIEPQKCLPRKPRIDVKRVRKTLSLDSAILRTCHTIYSEAMPVLYAENTFLYMCSTSRYRIFKQERKGFPDVNLKHMKHLELEVHERPFCGKIATKGVADTIQYLVKEGAELRTFELVWETLDVISGDEDRKRKLPQMIAATQKFITELVALNVSETLTISICYDTYNHELQSPSDEKVQGLFQGMIQHLSSEKEMTVTTQEPELHNREYYHSKSYGTYVLSWCLRPQRSEQQSTTVASGSH